MSVRFFAFVLAFALGSCDQGDPTATTPTNKTPTNTEKSANPEATTPTNETPANPGKTANPEVVLETSSGTIVLELDSENAPLTTENFLTYVNDGFYDGTIFHRVIDDFMIQGGGFELIDRQGTQKETRDPVKNEAKNGLKNTRGTISMARTNDPHSATSQFFINLVDNPGLDPKTPENPQGFSPDGYAVFGKVTKGMDVVDKIRGVDTGKRRLKARGPGGDLREAPMQDVPFQNIIIEKATASQSR
ncbi:MAG: peptidylprolyl isomerase [Verrucomicrobiota bacterium]|nr:peptidylprolyl isomerase [Verrucomicrobiota bacterium]